jgi:hypothetical protein
MQVLVQQQRWIVPSFKTKTFRTRRCLNFGVHPSFSSDNYSLDSLNVGF